MQDHRLLCVCYPKSQLTKHVQFEQTKHKGINSLDIQDQFIFFLSLSEAFLPFVKLLRAVM